MFNFNRLVMESTFLLQVTNDFYDEIDRRVRKTVAEILEDQKKPLEINKFLTRHQVCKMLNISLPTLLSYSNKGILHGQKVGNRVLFDEQRLRDSLMDLPVKIRL